MNKISGTIDGGYGADKSNNVLNQLSFSFLTFLVVVFDYVCAQIIS